MKARKRKVTSRRRHFIAEWRRHRQLSQDRLAERIGISKATLSRIENRLIPYNQDFLETCAQALQCEPADLIMRDPGTPDLIWSVWETVPPAERSRATEVLKAFARRSP